MSASTRAVWSCLRPSAVDDRTDDDAVELAEARPRTLVRAGTYGSDVARRALGTEAHARARRDVWAVRVVTRALGKGEVAATEATLDGLGRELEACAAAAVLPRRGDAIVATLRAISRCGRAFEHALVDVADGRGGRAWEELIVLGDDETRALTTRNPEVATAYFEAMACVSGAEFSASRVLRKYELLGNLERSFLNDNRPLVLGIMEVFQSLASRASSDVAACVQRSKALQNFISTGFITMSERYDDGASDETMTKRFFAFVLAMLRSKNERFGAMAFEGVEEAATPVVSRLCLARAGLDANALYIYREIALQTAE